ncbi:MAG TPA: hypothetical protein VKD72_11530 [Gemmataceae bacterium]|nr:hypothetical protein [Gemmataceae bacterium]
MMDTSWFFSLLVPLAVGGLTLWLLVRRRHSRALQALLALRKRADRIAAEYPEEVQSWGGKKVLLNPDVVREIVAALETDMGTPTAP